MKGTIRFISIFEPRVTIELGMIAFMLAEDPVWDLMIKDLHDYFTILIDSQRYVMGPINDINQVMESRLNDVTKILVVEHENRFLPICSDDCLAMAKKFKLNIGCTVEYEVGTQFFGDVDVAVISRVTSYNYT